MNASAERMRILYVSGYGDIGGGGQISLLLLLEHLDKDQFVPLVLCPCEGELTRRARDLGAEVYIFGTGTSLDSRRALSQWLSLRRCAKALKADLVHCDTIYAALMSGLGLVGSTIPLVFHARTSASGGVLDSIVPLLCARILCVSKAAAKRFPTFSPSKAHVVYNGVDLGVFRPGVGDGALRKELGIAHDAFVVGYAGQLIKAKGLEVLLRAFSRLRVEFANTILLIAGRGRDEIALRATAGEGVRFQPFSCSMPEFYSSLDVFALPTLLLEGLSRSLIEAMACAVPSVATRLGGNAETLVDGETGLFVPAEDEGGLHGRLRDLYLDPGARGRMGAAARERAEKLFDAVACARAVEAIYLQVAP